MKEITTEIVFSFEGNSYSGKLTCSYDSGIKVNFVSDRVLTKFSSSEISIGIIYGSTGNPSGKVILYSCTLYSTLLASSGVFSYMIRSSYCLLGLINDSLSLEKVQNISFQFDPISDWVGRQNVSGNIDETFENYHLNVKMMKALERKISEDRSIKIKNYATVPLGVQDNGEYIIKQNTVFEFVIDAGLSLETIYHHYITLKNIISHCHDMPINLAKAFISMQVKYGEKDRRIDIDIYFRTKNCDATKIRKPIIQFNFVADNIASIYKNWEKLQESVPYITPFIYGYYTTNFIDQKLIALISVLESMYGKYVSDRKMNKPEYRRHIDNIISLLPEEYKSEVKFALNDRNRLSLKMRLEGLSEFSEKKIEFMEMIPQFVKFRNVMAHGHGLEDFSINSIIKMHELLREIYLKFFYEKIFCAPKDQEQ